jgi:tetratricopeptide (TPR) repeat protein/peroxiredoxin
MKRIVKWQFLILILLIDLVLINRASYGQLPSGQIAPLFSLQDLKGQTYDLSQMKEKPMILLYFFEVESRPSQEGLLTLNELTKLFKEEQLTVWAITPSPKNKVTNFVKNSGLKFSVLLDTSKKVSHLYSPSLLIFPNVYTLGPGLKVIDSFQGNKRTTETMLVRLSERNLQRKKTEVAKAISKKVIEKNPQQVNVKAMAVNGYAALKEGKLSEAEQIFKDLQKRGTEGGILGLEGLAAVHFRKGEMEKAFQLAKEVEKTAPNRAYPNVIKADIFIQQGKKEEAEAELRIALQKKEVESYQQAEIYLRLGRLYANKKQYREAQTTIEKGIEVDPFNIELTTGRGIVYEKEGNLDKALESYRQALALDKTDTFAVTLAKRVQELLVLQKDVKKKERVDQLVKELSEKYRSQKPIKTETQDTWTSRPMVLTFVDFEERGGLAERDGFSLVTVLRLGKLLEETGRVKVVDRNLMERTLEELNMSAQELADKETMLRLGRVMAAKLIGTGSIYYLPQGTMLSLRLIDTETTTLPYVTNKQFDPQISLEKGLYQLNREMLKTIISKYPLRGYIMKVAEDQAVLNLGSERGVVPGTKLDVLEEQEPILYKGRKHQPAPKVVGRVEVMRVEPDLCYAKIINQERSIKTDDKVQEKLEEMVLR